MTRGKNINIMFMENQNRTVMEFRCKFDTPCWKHVGLEDKASYLFLWATARCANGPREIKKEQFKLG